ncbi:glycosyltransferase family 2 protein [Vibrio splendidus]
MKLVSVIVSIFREPIDYISNALNSILNQSYPNIEIIIVVDNPSLGGDVLEYLRSISNQNRKVKLIFNENNLGLPMSLNVAIDHAEGDYIARMDADDISSLERLSVQVEYLERNKDFDLVGSRITLIDDRSQVIGKRNPPSVANRKSIRYSTLAFHPTWCGKTEVFKKLKYRNFKYSQDLDFLHRFLDEGYSLKNLDLYLLRYRITTENFNANKRLMQFLISKSIRDCFSKSCGSFEQISNHVQRLQENEEASNFFLEYDGEFLKSRYGMMVSCIYSKYHREILKNVLICKAFR